MLLSLFIIAGFSETAKLISKNRAQTWQFLNFQTLLLRRNIMRELTLNEMEEVSGGGNDPFEGLTQEEIHEIVNPHHNQLPPGY